MSKTITLSDEMFDKLTTISKNINSQDNRSTAMPYMIQISEDNRIDNPNSSDYLLLDCDNNEIDTSNIETLINNIQDLGYYEDEDKNNIDTIINDNKDFHEDLIIDGIEEYLINNHGMYKWHYSYEKKLSNAFFTNQGVQEHLNINGHNLNKGTDTDTYLTHLYRNSEMETVMQFLCELTGGKLHK